MANINDFKLVKATSERYFDYLGIDKDVKNIEKERLGFYLFILECVTGNKEISELKEDIVDANFQKVVFNKKMDDRGIDAVVFDEDQKIIRLFNFKYREKFNSERGVSSNEVTDSLRFIMEAISYEENDKNKNEDITPIEKKKITISRKLSSRESWGLELYLVANVNKGLDQRNEWELLKSLKENYGLKVVSVTLDDIRNFIIKKPEKITATFTVDNNSLMTYEEDNMSSRKSYLFRLPISELIRITCNDEQLRNNSNLTDYDVFSDVKLDYGVLYDNVRGFLGDTKFNLNIMKTLDVEPEKFFVYNNGITVIANEIDTERINAGKKLECTVRGIQVVNGGQTLRTLYNYVQNNFQEKKKDEKIANAEVLVRVFQTSNSKLTNDIAEYTNSQNAISVSELKSISNIQIQIEEYLKTKGIKYVRKSGEVGIDDTKYHFRISMESMAQLLYSAMGHPENVSNRKKLLFTRNYDEIFNDNTKVDHCYKLAIKYKEIQKYYEDNKELDKYKQKYFYMVYLQFKYNHSIEDDVKLIETTLKKYKKDSNSTDARKLIQLKFKELLDEEAKKI